MRWLKRYAQWAQEYRQRFKLIFGRWTVESDDLARAAHEASQQLVDTVRAAQERGALPAGPPKRLTALLRAIAHGAADLQAAGHLSPGGKGRLDAAGLVDDLLDHFHPRLCLPQ